MCASRFSTARWSEFFFCGEWAIGLSNEEARPPCASPPQGSQSTAEESTVREASLNSTPQTRDAEEALGGRLSVDSVRGLRPPCRRVTRVDGGVDQMAAPVSRQV